MCLPGCCCRCSTAPSNTGCAEAWIITQQSAASTAARGCTCDHAPGVGHDAPGQLGRTSPVRRGMAVGTVCQGNYIETNFVSGLGEAVAQPGAHAGVAHDGHAPCSRQSGVLFKAPKPVTILFKALTFIYVAVVAFSLMLADLVSSTAGECWPVAWSVSRRLGFGGEVCQSPWSS